MLAIVMTYHNRLEQLKITLKSISKSQHKDFEVIVVDDCSDEEVKKLPQYSFPITVLRLTDRKWFNSCVPYNKGFYYAMLRNPEVVIIQNAECYHSGDVITRASSVKDDEYLSFHCYSLAKDEVLGKVTNNKGASFDGDSAWYNHEIYRPVGYHFCTALTGANLRKLNGFDERFMNGKDYDDNYLLHQVRTLGLKIKFVPSPFVYHQWHYSAPRLPGPADNKKIYEDLIRENNYRAKHINTPDL